MFLYFFNSFQCTLLSSISFQEIKLCIVLLKSIVVSPFSSFRADSRTIESSALLESSLYQLESDSPGVEGVTEHRLETSTFTLL